MTDLIAKLTGKPVQEAMSECDFVNMIVGAAAGDMTKLADGLKTLKKGQLKKLYAAITGEQPEVGSEEVEDGEDGDEGDNEDEEIASA